jgi:hypothetical protein
VWGKPGQFSEYGNQDIELNAAAGHHRMGAGFAHLAEQQRQGAGQVKSPTTNDEMRPRKSGSHQTHWWRKPDSNLVPRKALGVHGRYRLRFAPPISDCRKSG